MKAVLEGFVIPDNPPAFSGLKPTAISRLTEIAIFTGPNGGGKSRLLRVIGSHANSISQRNNILNGIQQQKNNERTLSEA